MPLAEGGVAEEVLKNRSFILLAISIRVKNGNCSFYSKWTPPSAKGIPSEGGRGATTNTPLSTF